MTICEATLEDLDALVALNIEVQTLHVKAIPCFLPTRHFMAMSV
jgi:hypothetical protein